MLTRAEAEAAARRTVATRTYADIPELAEPAIAALTEALLDRDRADRGDGE